MHYRKLFFLILTGLDEGVVVVVGSINPESQLERHRRGTVKWLNL